MGDNTGAEHGPGATPSTPLWVKAFGIVVLSVVVLFVVVMLAGGGHGPGLHAPP